MLRAAVTAADPAIAFVPSQPEWLEPSAFVPPPGTDLVLLNFHRALHSKWTPAQVRERLTGRWPVVVVFHDTYETQSDRLPWDLLEVCDAMIVHESCDLQGGWGYNPPDAANGPIAGELWEQARQRSKKVHYWRQGVPEPDWRHIRVATVAERSPHAWVRPIVGTCGFAFPWKGFELLCDAAAAVGWGVLICSHNATPEQVNDWQARNPWVEVDQVYRSTPDMIARLAVCDATAFLYACQNSGTSAAIRLGIAAGKPLLASRSRQFSDLAQAEAPLRWVDPLTPNEVAAVLAQLQLGRFDPGIVRLREQDGWRRLGQKYADLFTGLGAR